MNILVTGGAGFIGSAVCRLLSNDPGHHVVNIDKLTYAGNLESLRQIENYPNYSFVKADICETSAVADLLRRHEIDVVMHLAAESHVDRSIDGPSAFIETNIVGTFRLLTAALAYWRSLSGDKKSAFRFHHVSTDEVFGDLPFEEGVFTEDTPYAPSSPYSASKAASDHLVRAWHETYGLPAVISNCSNNYGPFHFPEKLIPLAILNALHERPIPVYGAGANVRDWLFVDDHARALRVGRNQRRAGPKLQCRRQFGAQQPRRRRDDMRRARPNEAAAERAVTATSSRSFPTVRVMTADTPSTPRRSAANLAGSRRKPSRAGLPRRCAGISTMTGGGSRSATANMPASGWVRRRWRSEDPGNRARRAGCAKPGRARGHAS